MYSQSDTIPTFTDEFIEDILIESGEETDNAELLDIVEELIRNPIDINSADLIELLKLPEMDNQSAKILLNARNKFGPFFATNELFAIKELDRQLIEKILPFIKVSSFEENQTNAQQTKDFYNDFFTRSKIIIRSRLTTDLQNRKGFLTDKFQGSKLKSYNRILYGYSNNFQVGALTEKDPGEKSFTDFYSYHLQIKNVGLLNNLVLGDYLLEFGQGLAMWSPFGFSKGADAIFPVKKRARYVRPYTSSLEYRFFRGAASTLKLDNISITAFYSDKSFDATLDSISGLITSFGQTGYHRFGSELNRKNSTDVNTFGGVIDFKFIDKFYTGLLYYNSKFTNTIAGQDLYDLNGDNFSYLSAFYDFNFDKINLFGEFSYNGTSVASINGFQFSAARNFIFTSAIRSYPRNYNNLFGFGFSERSGRINNELGIYTGIKWRLPVGTLNFYFDIFKFPYRTNENSLSSEGNEILLDFVTKPLPKFETRLRYKYENKEVTELANSNEIIVKRLKQIIRTELLYEIFKNLRLRTRLEYNNFYIKDVGQKENGFLIFQEARYLPVKNLTTYARIIFFQTDSFNSAVYQYENDLLGVMPNLAMYGKGIRWYFILRYKASNFISISAKYSETYKPDAKSISSGDNEIIGNLDNRFGLQIDMNF